MHSLRNILSIHFFLFLSLNSIGKSDSTGIKFSIIPIVAYNPETSFLFGVGANIVFSNGDTSSEYFRPSSIAPTIIYSLKNQLLFNFRANLFIKEKYNSYFKVEIVNFPTPYFGTGNATTPDVENITVNYIIVNPSILKNINQNLFLGAIADIDHYKITKYIPNGKYETDQPFGNEGGLQLGLGPAIKFDTRDNIFFPYKGIFIDFKSYYYFNTTFTDYSYSNFSIEIREFVSLAKGHILAFNLFNGNNLGTDVPFYKYNLIGGDSKLRGIILTRYLDKISYYAQTEYRANIYKKIWGTAFIGIGDVASKYSSYKLDETKIGYGIGIRYQLLEKERIMLRLDYARSNNSGVFYFSLGEAF